MDGCIEKLCIMFVSPRVCAFVCVCGWMDGWMDIYRERNCVMYVSLRVCACICVCVCVHACITKRNLTVMSHSSCMVVSHCAGPTLQMSLLCNTGNTFQVTPAVFLVSLTPYISLA